MNATLSVGLSALITVTGIVDVSSLGKPLDRLNRQSTQRPIFDPDDGSGRSFEQDKPRIDRFASAMKENSSSVAYIVAYGGLVSYRNEARIRLNCTRKYLIDVHGISPSRLRLIDGGYRPEVTVRLLLVKPGDPKPTPFPTVNREAVRITKAFKHSCGKAMGHSAKNP
jgi:hypothetical protein